MIEFYVNCNLIVQTLIACTFTFLITTLGAAIVFFFKKVNNTVLDAMLGLSGGVMIAASFFSLLKPAIEDAMLLGMIPWFVVSIGFLCGALFLIVGDVIFDKTLNKKEVNKKEKTSLKRSIMLIVSITLHNIPEGLAIGVAFGSLSHATEANLMAAVMLAVGIGIQNFPEGCAVSLPLRRENFSRGKSFLLGALSGIVEPIAGVVGCVLVMYVTNIMPFLLSAAAGAMIYVVISELIPESQKNKKKNVMSICTIVGFMIMMMLDVALG